MNDNHTTEELVKSLVERVMERLDAEPQDVAAEIGDALRRQQNQMLASDALGLIAKHVQQTVNDQNDATRFAIERWLIRKDREVRPWVADTPADSPERRNLVYDLLKLNGQQREVLDANFPAFARIVIAHAAGWADWYTEERRRECEYYGPSLLKYLGEQKGWSRGNLNKLDRETNDIIANIADPRWAAPEANPRREYSARGLVVGYVQSGKTTTMNMTIAKAVDAGYKLIIVLAGLTDLLRTQTQRRLDMEVVGQQILLLDPEVKEEPGIGNNDGGYLFAKDWNEFIVHPTPNGRQPRSIERLTTRLHDFSTWRGGQAFPLGYLQDPNICKIVVIKKNVSRLKKLVRQLNAISPEHKKSLSVLVLDDESDQAAAINLVNPAKNQGPNGEIVHKGINEQLVKIMDMMGNAQYVGLTATPAANCFIAPEEEGSLYPKDFILLLERPMGYMGILDFHDIDEATLLPLPTDVPQVKKQKHVRDIRLPKGQDRETLQACLDTYVLAGALKLYRAERQPNYKAAKHHTLLYSDSVFVKDMQSARQRIVTLWQESGFESRAGLDRLAQIYQGDIVANSDHQGDPLFFPDTFESLLAHISESVRRIEENFDGHEIVLMVNGDPRESDPDFQERSVWKVIIGGMKLSRGYTVEGLTVTYFRRHTKIQSTLMQMGRWFGYRAGYQDLVRLYISRAEGAASVDIYDVFEKTCRDEEGLRRDFIRWYNTPDPNGERVTPEMMRAVVSVCDTQLLPAPKEAMRRAEFASLTVTDLANTRLDLDNTALEKNQKLWRTFLKRHLNHKSIPLHKNETVFVTSEVPHAEVIGHLRNLSHSAPWERHRLFLDFVTGQECTTDGWIVLMPQLVRGENGHWKSEGLPDLTLHGKSWDNRGHDPALENKIISTIAGGTHRQIASLLCDNSDPKQPKKPSLDSLPPEIRGLARQNLGIILLYPSTIAGETHEIPVMAYECILSYHPLKYSFRVRDPRRPANR